MAPAEATGVSSRYVTPAPAPAPVELSDIVTIAVRSRADRYPVIATEILEGSDTFESRLAQTSSRRAPLVPAVFDEQPAESAQMHSPATDDLFDILHPRSTSAYQRCSWFESQIALIKMRIRRSDVRRIRNDQVEAFVGEGGVPVALDQAHMRTKGVSVAARHFKRCTRDIGSGNFSTRQFKRKRYRQHAAAGTEVENPRRLRAIYFLEYLINQSLGLRTRNQHVRRDLETSTVEFTPANQIGNRFAGSTARHERLERSQRLRLEFALGVGGKLSVIESGYMLQQQARVYRLDSIAGKRQRIAD